MMSDFFLFLRRFTVSFRRFAAVILAVSLVACSFFGCSRNAVAELFFYREADLRANITFECNGVESRFYYERIGGVGTVTFTYPQELEGFMLRLSSDEAFIIYDGLEAEAPSSLALIPGIMGEIFSLSPDSVTLVETVESSDGTKTALTKISASGVSVTVDSDGIPVCAEGVLFGVSFRAEIAELSVITV